MHPKTKVANLYRTYREVVEMFEDENTDVKVLVKRLNNLFEPVRTREGVWEAMEEYGLFPEEDEVLPE
jgi:hypothetical protein